MKRIGLISFSIGIRGFVVFACLNTIYIPRIHIVSHQPKIGGFESLKYPIMLGQYEQGTVRVYVKNPRDYSLQYQISVIQDPNTSQKEVIGQVTITIPAYETRYYQFPIIGETAGIMDLRVEAISGEDPEWLESGGGYLPKWNSSYGWGCVVRTTGANFPFNLFIRIAAWTSVFLCILGAIMLLQLRLKKHRKQQ